MGDTTGNFNDLVQLSGDTLNVLGEALTLGNSAASTLTWGFSNSGGVLAVLAAPTANATLWLTGGGGTILTNINVSAGTTSNNLSAFTVSNSNNVSFGLNGSTLTASITVATLSNSNNISFGINASTITASYAFNVSAGTTSNNVNAVTFSNSNGMSFGLNGSTITGSAGFSVSLFSQDADFVTNFSISQATLSFQKFSIPAYLSATQLAFIADFELSSGSSGAVTVSHALYTFNASTASLASSASSQFSWTSGSQTSASSRYGGASGTQYRTMTVAYALTPGDYLAAWVVSTSNSVTVNMVGRAGINIVNTYDGFATSMFLNGTSNSSVTALPASVAATNTNYARTGSAVLRQPGMMLIGGTGL